MTSKHNQQFEMIGKDQKIQEQLLQEAIEGYIQNQRKKLTHIKSVDDNTANHDMSDDTPSESVFFELESKSELTTNQ